MSTTRKAVSRKLAQAAAADRLRRRNAWIIAVVVLGMVGLSGAGAYAFFLADPDLASLRQLDQEITALERSDNPQPDDAIVIEALRMVREEKLAELSDTQQAVLDQQREEQWLKREERREEQIDERLTEFFAMPAAERVAIVDKMIDSDEAMRRAWEERMAGREGGDDGGPRRGPPGGAANRPGGDNARGGDNRRGGRSPSTPERRKQRERQRLDRSTPQHRAQRTEFVRLIQERRKAQGLAPASTRQLFGMYRRLSAPPPAASSTATDPPRS